MTLTIEQVKQCGTPREALLLLATAIDHLHARIDELATDPFEQPIDWDDHETHVALHGELAERVAADNRAVIDGNGDVVVKPVSSERQDAREDFVISNRLDEFFTGLSRDEFINAYVKGGPRWLYYTDRAAVMQMPKSYREALVADVLLDSPSEAEEIGRDVLKFDESMPEGAQVDLQRARLGKAGE